MVDQSIIETAKKYVQQIPENLKKAFLFGSYAKGLEREDSDIDIALVIGQMDDFFSIQMQLMRLRRKIDLRIEPHPHAADCLLHIASNEPVCNQKIAIGFINIQISSKDRKHFCLVRAIYMYHIIHCQHYTFAPNVQIRP